ncbi:hypothetical protein E6C60_0351 [Paenibacillus algicola]|uniref:Uncharacterized protein n=1 Tax=Paenibacillus algicola TaxID=2565926 RepID=A0A4P8XFD8_9BACL|nr:hypothetical protein E6C60_0351 [Paenibacillus algicola]
MPDGIPEGGSMLGIIHIQRPERKAYSQRGLEAKEDKLFHEGKPSAM